ncbi:gamma-glutamyl-gamma-aminobutyrate hydrolase family protein [Arthrobacter bambusae]|uniref:gamma-glutamyl-gamma-aminobutyrate hydrolase family protein n=1 Tax=Arthrobacter bambusae TaxID=1338426 RepID=UPI002786D2BA|nr:gamma-glutamyl-gamma-aminobutyrate hydrolase family protein [Arthrobacter bambusae]MDQ0029943.1 putative glutamine amidotransferase [Arthrobacter bambusae]MDQ0097539.1 putative glutamine amidotransferase [Arthrobacter bambusae]
MTGIRGVIAMPARLSIKSTDDRVAIANRVFHDVVSLVEAAGLKVLIVRDLDFDTASVDGIVLPGGGDVDPARYGGTDVDSVYDLNAEQDALDFGCAERAVDSGLPLLGICRGAQVLNVVRGGTLYEDLAPSDVEHRKLASPHDTDTWAWHQVEVKADSLLAECSGSTSFIVSSGHHQGIRRLGEGLDAVATANDGLVEAIEDRGRRLLGVQWHPEAAGLDPALQAAPFRWLVDAVSARTVGK